MKIKLIVNPTSRIGKAEIFLPKINKYFEENKIPFVLDRTSGPGHATLLAKNSIEAGFDPIVAIGGDGLINEIANGMIGSEASLGLIPCGEANDFSKMFGLKPRAIEEACRIISDGFTKKIDVGMINDRYFVNVAGIGVDAEVTERKARAKKYLRGFLGYYFQALLAFIDYMPKKVRIKINGVSLETTIFLISIGNGRYCGGGFRFTPDAELDDGLLDICLVKHPGKLKAALDLPQVPKGKINELPYVAIFRAKEINVSSEDLLTCHIDGEVSKAYEFRLKILPRKLKVLTKKSAGR